MIQIDVPQGTKKPSIPVTVKNPVSVIVTPKPSPKPIPAPDKPKKGGGSIIDLIIGGVLPIATNPILPGTNLPIFTPIPGKITTPISPNVPVLGELPNVIEDIKLPSLPAFPDLGLPSIGKFFDDLKVGGGIILLGIAGLVALLIITRK